MDFKVSQMNMSENLDSILDSCLDDLDTTPVASPPQQPAQAASEPPHQQHVSSPTNSGAPSNEEAAEMERFFNYMRDVSGSDAGKALFSSLGNESEPPNPEQMMQQMQALFSNLPINPPSASSSSSASSASALSASTSSSSVMAACSSSSSSSSSSSASTRDPFEAGVDRALQMLMQGLESTSPAGSSSSSSAGPTPGPDEEAFRKMMVDLDALSGKGDPSELDKMVESMMSQMMSKEFLYHPIKDVTDKYPGWLAEQKNKQPREELTKYEKQYECFQRICLEFEKEKEDRQVIMQLMSEMHQYGPPPKEIVASLLPPVEHGQPLFPPGLAGLPGLSGAPGASGPPGAQGPGDKQPECSLM